MAIASGAFLMLPPDSFAAGFGVTIVADIPEEIWGAMFLVIGLSLVFALSRGWSIVRVAAFAPLAFFWMFFGLIALGRFAPSSTMYIFMGLRSLFCLADAVAEWRGRRWM